MWPGRLTRTTFEPQSLGPLGSLPFFDLFQKVLTLISYILKSLKKKVSAVGPFGREFPFEDLTHGCSMGVL